MRGPVAPTPIQSWFFEQRLRRSGPLEPGVPLRGALGRRRRRPCSEALGHVVGAPRRTPPAGGGPGPDVDAAATTRASPPHRSRGIDLTQVAPDAHAASIETAAIAAQSQLDLHGGPLLAAVHFDRGAAPGRLLLVVHHLAVDGVSWRVLIEDLETAYRALLAGSPVQLRPDQRPSSAGRRRSWTTAANAELRESAARWLEIGTVDGDLPEGKAGAGHEHGGAGPDRDGVARRRRDSGTCSSGFRPRTGRRSTTSSSPRWR